MRYAKYLLLGLTALGAAGAIAYPLFQHGTNCGSGVPRCRSNLRQLSTAAIMYTADFDDMFMPAATWMDSLKEYLKDESRFTCPEIATQGGKYGYAMNRTLDKVSLNIVEMPSTTLLLYESSLLLRNASEIHPHFPDGGRIEGANFAGYADGHVAKVDDAGRKL